MYWLMELDSQAPRLRDCRRETYRTLQASAHDSRQRNCQMMSVMPWSYGSGVTGLWANIRFDIGQEEGVWKGGGSPPPAIIPNMDAPHQQTPCASLSVLSVHLSSPLLLMSIKPKRPEHNHRQKPPNSQQLISRSISIESLQKKGVSYLLSTAVNLMTSFHSIICG